MKRFPYLFRMDPDERELLDRLATRYPGKREALSAALYALSREVAEREAGTAASREAILDRLRALEEQVAQLSRAPAATRRSPPGRR